MTPTSSPPRTPPGSPRITPQVPANTRRISKVLAHSMGLPGSPTLVMLMTGGLSHMADTLIREWQESAMAKECSFCAIEVSEAAKSDSELPRLLSAHAPHGAHLYIVKRDSNVSGDEIQQLREVLDSLQIQPARSEPLNANDSSTWAFPVLAEVKLEERVESADRDRSLEGVRAKQTPEDKEEVLELKARYAGLRAAQDAVRKLLEQKQLQSFEQHTHIQDALLKRSRDIGAGIEEKAPSLSRTIVDAFNRLQFSENWQGLAGTPGAKAVSRTMQSLYARLDDETKSYLESFLETLFDDMRKKQVLVSVLNAAAQVPAGAGDVIAVSRMCMAYMEHQVASGALDAKPLVALGYARCVQRFALLENIYQSELAAVQNMEKPNPPLANDLCMAFEAALIAVLRDAGERGLHLQEDLMPEVVDTIHNAWQAMKQRGNEDFKDFLAQPPWREFISRSWARLRGNEKK